MQSTGQTSTQAVSQVPTHGSAIIYAMNKSPLLNYEIIVIELGLNLQIIKKYEQIIKCTINMYF